MSSLYSAQSNVTHNPQDLFDQNLDLVRKIAWHIYGHMGSRSEVSDLIQVGMIGLLEASRKYTYQEGSTFVSYAAVRVRGAIFDYLRKEAPVGRLAAGRRRKHNEAVAHLTKLNNRPPEKKEIADYLGLEMSQYYQLETYIQGVENIDIEIASINYPEFFESKEKNPISCLEEKELKELINESIEGLSEKERIVLNLYFVNERNLHEIAKIIGVSVSRVSQIKTIAIEKIKAKIY